MFKILENFQFYPLFLIFQLLATNQGHLSMAAMNTVAEVLNKLLVVGITDTGRLVHGYIIGLDKQKFSA